MLTMILKMTLVTTLYVLLTMFLWIKTNRRSLSWPVRLGIGVIYGLCSVLSTHFGVDFSHMLLNVRDMGPLCAGLFFDPFSGILAGVIGGVERYIAGTYWATGAYTTVACSVSTCLAGFLSAFLHIFIFKRKKPSAIYAFFMGAVMEVFHMYAVLITHRDDMSMAFYVVKICAAPMIGFTALGMAVASTMIRVLAGEWKNPFRRVSAEEIPVSHRFQFWLFIVTFTIMVVNLLFSFAVQTQTAIQEGRDALAAASGNIRETYNRLQQTREKTVVLAGETARKEALALASSLNDDEDVYDADEEYLERIRGIFGLVAITAIDENGEVTATAGQSPVYPELVARVLENGALSATYNPSSVRSAAAARCTGGMIQVVLDKNALVTALNLAGLNESLSNFHVGVSGTFDIIRSTGIITEGDHKGVSLTPAELDRLKKQTPEVCFEGTQFGIPSLCRIETLENGLILLTTLPTTEIYASRDAQTYETAFAGILLFAVIYVLISMLVQGIVVNNLDLINVSLDRITNGDLNEVVSVRSSSEFASLSDDINQTVSVLKGYIAAVEKRMEQELELAYTIQDSSLPKNFAFPRTDFELFAMMDPAREIGGDFYDFFFLGQNRLALVIADVSGKGIPAALFMMRSKTAIRGLAESGQTPSEILYRANNALCEGNDAEMFVTVWLGIIDLSTGLMHCASAGHEYPVLMRAGGEYELYKDRHGLALAAMEGVRFREYELQLCPGDRLFVYTDGVPEAIDGSMAQYGTDRLLSILNQTRDEPLQAVLPAVRGDISAFAGETEQFDDITMLGFVYNGQEKGGEGHEGTDA